MQVEHVAGVCLTARWAAQQQRHLTVRLSLLGEVVVHDECVFGILHPVLTHGATGVGRQVFERRRVRGRSHDNDGVVHGTVLAERFYGLGNGRTFEANGNVNALHAQALLVQDGVDRNGGLAGLAVTNDELALATTDGGHGVDGLDTGLEWLVHRLATHDAGRLDFHTTLLDTDQRALAINRLAKTVHYPTEHAITDGNRKNSTGGLDGLAFFDTARLAEHNGADRGFVEVEREADGAVLELEHLVDRGVRKARHAGNTVTHFGDATDGLCLQ